MNTSDIAAAFSEGAGISHLHTMLAIAIFFLMVVIFLTATLLSFGREIKHNNASRTDLIKPFVITLAGTALILGFFTLLTF